jgi:hypothetical protein
MALTGEYRCDTRAPNPFKALVKPAARMFEDDHKREAGGTDADATSVARYTGRP